MSLTITLLLLGSFFRIGTEPWPEVLKDKVEKVVMTTFGTEAFAFTLAPVPVAKELEGATRSTLQGHFFHVKNDSGKLGYIYVSQAPSMKNIFDYIVVFDPELKVQNVKVLIYREQHGRQIGSPRWLSQFKGMTPADRPALDRNIDNITGATISCRNMTLAMHELLSSVEMLARKNALDGH